jgi:hypothetical protein
MNVSVTVDRPSDLLIMLSASSYNTANGTMYVRALINEYQLSAKLAWPVEVPLASGSRYASNACNFLYHATAPGTYKIYIQWRVDAGIAYLSSRSLTVIVLP